jgi:hypothetical protein
MAGARSSGSAIFRVRSRCLISHEGIERDGALEWLHTWFRREGSARLINLSGQSSGHLPHSLIFQSKRVRLRRWNSKYLRRETRA